jgi:hypothetical protein
MLECTSVELQMITFVPVTTITLYDFNFASSDDVINSFITQSTGHFKDALLRVVDDILLHMKRHTVVGSMEGIQSESSEQQLSNEYHLSSSEGSSCSPSTKASAALLVGAQMRIFAAALWLRICAVI